MTPLSPHPLPLADGDYTGLVLVTLLLIGLCVAAARLLAYVRKRSRGESLDNAHAAGGFSLGSLRDLVRAGKMTQEEYDATKAQIVAAHQRNVARTAAAAPKARPDLPPGFDDLPEFTDPDHDAGPPPPPRRP